VDSIPTNLPEPLGAVTLDLEIFFYPGTQRIRFQRPSARAQGLASSSVASSRGLLAVEARESASGQKGHGYTRELALTFRIFSQPGVGSYARLLPASGGRGRSSEAGCKRRYDRRTGRLGFFRNSEQERLADAASHLHRLRRVPGAELFVGSAVDPIVSELRRSRLMYR